MENNKITIHFTEEKIHNIFNNALITDQKTRTNFFFDIRSAFLDEIILQLQKNNINSRFNLSQKSYSNILNGTVKEFKNNPNSYDIEFCYRYGFREYSIEALNYLNGQHNLLPSILPFQKVPGFSIGNFAIQIDYLNFDIEIEPSDEFSLVGYSYLKSTKKRGFLYLFGVSFIGLKINQYLDLISSDCQCNFSDLDEIKLTIYQYPIMFICRKCGKLQTCKCFENEFDVDDDILRLLGGRDSNSDLFDKIEEVSIRNNLCHLCTRTTPKLIYVNEMYASAFLQRFYPYFKLYAHRSGSSEFCKNNKNKIENELRVEFGYPLIGEKWISETILFKIVSTIFSPKEVIFHYRGPELKGLEIDIWVPDLKLAIEYQGQQHYKPVEHWGGENALKELKKRDKKKKEICNSLGYQLIEIKYTENITLERIERKILKHLKNQ